MPDSSVDPEASDELIRRNGWALGILATYLGAVTVLCHFESGLRRWSAAVWQYAMQVPGSPAAWGFVIGFGGLLLLYGNWKRSRRASHWGHGIAFLWCVAIAGTQLFSMIDDDAGTANPIGLGVWTYLAFIYSSRRRLSSKRFHA